MRKSVQKYEITYPKLQWFKICRAGLGTEDSKYMLRNTGLIFEQFEVSKNLRFVSWNISRYKLLPLDVKIPTSFAILISVFYTICSQSPKENKSWEFVTQKIEGIKCNYLSNFIQHHFKGFFVHLDYNLDEVLTVTVSITKRSAPVRSESKKCFQLRKKTRGAGGRMRKR